MKLIAPLSLAFLLFFSCTDQQGQIDRLQKEVIKIHDDVMPKTADIIRTQKALKVYLQDSTVVAADKKKIERQLKVLDEADKAMSDWMANYKNPSEEDTFETAMNKLNQEKEKINKVKDMMLNSLETGTQLLKTLKAGKDNSSTNKE